MSDVVFYWVLLVVLLLVSGFFSSSETGMMSVNRYRLRHLARKGGGNAKSLERLLSRPDRLLGVILLGNTFANICASSIATILVNRYFPHLAAGVLLGAVALTFLVLIFAETAPKTFAALYPQKLSLLYARPLSILLKIFYPMVLVINFFANALLRMFGVKSFGRASDALSVDEFKTVVNEAAGKIRKNYKTMLLRILDLEKVSVEHVMVPKANVFIIDLTCNFDVIKRGLSDCVYNYVPLCEGGIDHVKKILDVKLALAGILNGRVNNAADLLAIAEKPSFVPCEAEVSQQLIFFQENKHRLSCVVDEYANIVGLLTLKDMVDEIVADFTVNVQEFSASVRRSSDGGMVVSGQVNLLELDRLIGSNLSTLNSVTLSGLLVEHLEMIPERKLCVRVSGYPMEIMKTTDSMITLVKIFPELKT